MRKIADTHELQAELRRLISYAQSDRPSRSRIAGELERLSERVAGERTAMMSQEQLIKVFDSLKPKQRVKASIRAVMGHGDSESGVPTEYIVGRRGKGRFGETVTLLPADGSKSHPMAQKKLFKRKNHDGEMSVSVAIGDMGATLVSLELA